MRQIPRPSARDPAEPLLLHAAEGEEAFEELARGPASALAIDQLAILRAGLAETGPLPGARSYVFAVGKHLLQFLRGPHLPISESELFCEFRHPFTTELSADIRLEVVSARPELDLQLRLGAVGPPLPRSRITLRANGQTVNSIPLDSSGAATVTMSTLGRYELELRHGDVTGLLRLDLRSSQ